MDPTRAAPTRSASPEIQPALLAKAALRRLLTEKLDPTPDNYARAYRQEAGQAAAGVLPERAQKLIERVASRAFDGETGGVAADFSQALAQGRWEQAERALESVPPGDASALAALIERIVRGVERGGRNWTTARKKESLQRVLSGSRSDGKRLQQRLTQLVGSWDGDSAAGGVERETPDGAAPGTMAAPLDTAATRPAPLEALPEAAEEAGLKMPPTSTSTSTSTSMAAPLPVWGRVVGSLGSTVHEALPTAPHPAGPALAAALAALTQRLQADGASTPLADELERCCDYARRLLQHRHHLTEQLGGLCLELTESLTGLAEDDSWAQGQCDAMRQQLADGITARGVRSVSELLRDTRTRQGQLRIERQQARDALKLMFSRMLSELDQLGSQTGRFHESVGRYAGVIEQADTLESLADVVREMVEESRTVQSLVQQTQERLQSEVSKATDLSARVIELEAELRRMSSEVSTDQLTQIANRRGLMQAFEAERSRMDRSGSGLCIGLLDIDNFKRLNDELGHAAGDEALKALASVVSETLRPTDLVARYGGEEFVVLLPDTPLPEAQQILSRLQRSLTGGLFMHEQKSVLVTFSAGVTPYRDSERLEEALERADQALYEAKRTGKNRTCIG